MGLPTPPATVATFKLQFDRDFIFGTGKETVRDSDVQNALNFASSSFNPELFDTAAVGSTSESLMCYQYAAAHFLVMILQAAGGLSAVARGAGVLSQGEGQVASKGVGGVSISFSWPAAITDSPALFQFTRTQYGLAYLQVLATRLVGNVSAALGGVTNAPDIPFF